ncbi:hypothetical protein BDZ89DRAFT_1144593 [Hymenopellis radicata]|nr:hypothetical protein BDZ89DRAFT_1144593 [Hymenopellis radicata]
MANISTPSLERLVIRGGSPEISLPCVKEMLQQSGCSLRHLTLQSLGKDDIDAVHSLIHQCGLLRELCLLDIHADTDCITQLPSSLESLSQLRVLVLDISRVHGFCTTTQITVADGILAFLESRRRPADATGVASHVDLETFTLHAPIKEVFDFTEGQYQRIKALRASGLLFYMCRYSAKDRRLYD